jgi:hypothetical protein
VQQGEDAQWTLGSGQFEVGHAPAQQRVPVIEVVADVEAGEHAGDVLARFVHAQQSGKSVAKRVEAGIASGQWDLGHRGLQHAGGDRMTFGLVGVQEAVGRGSPDHLGELPAQVHRILHSEVEALPADRVVDVRGVAGQEHASLAVGRGLTGGVGEPGDPSWAVHPEVSSVDRNQRLA